MKKPLAALTIAACMCIAASAMAAGVKVPKLLCLDSGEQQLSLKAIGTVYIRGIKVKTYAINGYEEHGPLTGTAYVEPGTTTLRASYSTTYTDNESSQAVDAGYNLVFDLAAGSGTLDYRYATAPNNDLDLGNLSINSIDCITSATRSAKAATNTPAAQQ